MLMNSSARCITAIVLCLFVTVMPQVSCADAERLHPDGNVIREDLPCILLSMSPMVSRMPDDICSAPDVASASSCMSSSVRFPKLSCMWYMQMLHTVLTLVSIGFLHVNKAMNVVMSSTFSLSAVSVSLR